MRPNKRLLHDWIAIAGMAIVAFAVPVWKYRAGDCSPRVALVSGLLSLLVVYAVLLLTIRVRNRRLGLPSPRSLLIGAIFAGMLAAGGLWVTLANEMGEKDLMMTALSSKPISEIRPEEKALVVQLLRKELKRNRDYEHTVSQIKPLNPPLFSNESFRSVTTMQQEIDGLKQAVALDFATHDQHQRDLAEFRSLMMKRYPAYLKSFNSGIRNKEESWEEVLSLERQLLNATIDLYEFAARNPENISFQNGNLISHDPGVWNSFAKKRNNCVSLLQELRRLVPNRLFV
jgi:hypothetical protein